MKKFNIKISKIKYGWVVISIYADNKLITNISGSGVYNPFYDIKTLFFNLRARKHYIWEIDQEGRTAKFHFKNLRKTLVVTIENEFKKRDLKEPISETFTFSKRQLLNELKRELNQFRKREYKLINNKTYTFWFREIK